MKRIIFFAILTLLILLVFFIFFERNPVKVGVSTTLSGTNSPMGIAIKDGVELAIEEINEQGGINRKKLELIIKDDQNDPQRVLKVDEELINEGVCAIIGHVTSAMTQAALPLVNEKQMLLLSPTTSSLKVLEGDDNLISIHPPNIYEQEALAQYAIQHSNRLSIIYNTDNEAFSDPWVTYFSETFEELGGTIEAIFSFSVENDEVFKATGDLLATKPEGVLIVASSIDTAMICQQISKQYPQQVFKCSSGWSLDNTLLEHGGKSIEGLVLPNSWDKNSTSPGYLTFKNAFITRFRREPQFAETYAYETMMILAEILKSGIKPNPMQIKEKILNIGQIQGLQGKIIINEKGITKRDVFLFRVEKNSFKRITE
ncbi:MAG: ABC transporter substrate-binding protein [Thermotogota bacterium]